MGNMMIRSLGEAPSAGDLRELPRVPLRGDLTLPPSPVNVTGMVNMNAWFLSCWTSGESSLMIMIFTSSKLILQPNSIYFCPS